MNPRYRIGQRLAGLLLAAAPLFAQCPTGTLYPGAIDTNASLTVAKNNLITTLTVTQQITDTVAIVASTTGWVSNQMAAVDTGAAIEYEFVTSVSGANTLNVSRACEGSVAVQHLAGAPVDNNATAYSGHTSVTSAVTAIETLVTANPTAHRIPVAEGTSPFTYLSPGTTGQILTSNGTSADPTFQPSANPLPSGQQLQYLRIQPNTGNNTTTQFNVIPAISMSDYNFPSQNPSGSIVAGNNSITMVPVPLGVNGTDTGHYLEVTGTPGAAEACLITGGSGTAGQTSGTIIINCANTHNSGFTVASATAGCGEATSAFPNGASINIPQGTFVFNATCSFQAWHQFFGASRGNLNTNGTVIDARTVSTTLAAFQFLSAVQGSGYDVDSGIRFQDIEMECFRCILINQESLPSFQGNIKNSVFQHLRMNGTYASATDPNRWTNVVPTLTTMRTFGVLISCNACFDSQFSNLEIENGGIGIYLQSSDINTIGESSRFANDGVAIWMDGTGSGSGTNKILNNDMLANQRVPMIFANGLIHPVIENNYFESYCPSGQAVRSVGTTGLIYAFNRIDDPNNPAGCTAQGGPGGANTTPVLHLEDSNSDYLLGNFLNNGAGIIPQIEIAYTNWASNHPNFVQCIENNQYFPCPNGQFQTPTGVFYPLAPGVLSAPLNPYLMRANNMPSDSISGTCSSSFANVWHQSAVLKQGDNSTFRWVQNTGTCIWTFKLQTQEYTNFLFQFTGRKIGTGAGAFTIQYTDAAGTLTTLQSSSLNFVATTEVETRDVQIQLPSTAVGPGKFTLTMDGSNGEIEQIEIIPQPGGNPPTLSGCTFSAQVGGSFAGGFTGGYTSGTTGACTVTFTFPGIARNGWMCSANDLTTPADVQNQTVSSATGATVSGTTVSGDVINFSCFPY